MAKIDTSKEAVGQRKYIVSQLRAMDGTPNVCPRAGMFGESADLIEALSRELEAMRAELDDALSEVSACKELGGCGYWRDRSRAREAERDAAIAREQAFGAVLEGAGYQKIDSITTPEYGRALGEMVATRTKEIILDITAALAREHALQARVAELERVMVAQAKAITDQVRVTRAYAADSDMGANNVLLIEINTSHFLDYAHELRAALSREGGE